MANCEKIIEVKDGTLRFVWSDDFAALRDEGVAKIERASHVEPNEEAEWMADMMPCGGPVLGPFSTRDEALKAELAWIRENLSL